MSAIAESCECGQPADFTCQLNTMEPPREVTVRGVTKIIQPYKVRYLCAACTRAAVTGGAPPRKATALPHHAAELRRERIAAAKALVGNVEEQRLGDWGRPA